jgi:methionyl-tRNA formyltransferase
MKIAFFGTPDFAIPSLEALAASDHQIRGVVTAPDKPRGRGQSVIPTPIARAAETMGIETLKPIDLNNPDFLSSLESWDADAFAVVAFRILPEAVFGMPEFGAINLHASLLPKYRGAAPIQWALWNGETETGVTTFQIQLKVDTGNILKQRRVEISEADDAGSLSDILSTIGAEVLLDTLNELEAGTLTPLPQDTTQATRAPKIQKEHCLIDWTRSAQQIRNQVRALTPQPAAYTLLEGKTVKIFQVRRTVGGAGLDPGTVNIGDHEIQVGTGSDVLRIAELQFEGKKRMETEAFLRGYRPRGTFRFGDK